jgi:hypothetical protein
MEGGRRNSNDENTKENKLTTEINLVFIFIFYFKNYVEISLDNIRDSEGVALLIYIKNI